MAIYLFETRNLRQRFYPLTANKNVANLLLGGYELLHWWRIHNASEIYILTEDYLQTEIPAFIEPGDLLINGGAFPGAVDTVFQNGHGSQEGTGLRLEERHGGQAAAIMAVRIKDRLSTVAVRACLFENADPDAALATLLASQNIVWADAGDYQYADRPEILLKWQSEGIKSSVLMAAAEAGQTGIQRQALHESNRVTGDHPVIVAPGATVRMSFFNTENGPVYIGENATVMEGAMLRGPLYIGDRSVIKMGTRLYGPVVTGPACVLGGEIKNVVFQKGSNKAHDGYLGDSMIGAWCNFGAGSGGSNLKNTAGEISFYDYSLSSNRKIGVKFGALVGDYTRIGVATQLSAGASIGLCCNLFGQQMLPGCVADFSWGCGDQLTVYALDKAIEHLRKWRKFKGSSLTDREIRILHHIFDQTGGRA